MIIENGERMLIKELLCKNKMQRCLIKDQMPETK
jgi:hypothetical protein